MAKIGENAVSNMIEQGRIEAAQFNEGLRAVDSPPIVQEAQETSYTAMMKKAASLAQTQQQEPTQELSR